jgi:FKBP-type peptidyl-prolyl cis-trans isomerase
MFSMNLIACVVIFIIMLASSTISSALRRNSALFGKSQLNGLGKSLLTIRGGSTSEATKPFYTFGVLVSRQLGEQMSGIKNTLSKEELDVFLQGFTEGMKGEVTNEQELFAKFGPKIEEIMGSRAKQTLENEKKRGSEFATKYLLSNPKAIRTPSGLIYNEIISGIGMQATSTSKVTVHYTGTLANGDVFDSSVQRGEPITFPLTNVIKGWQEGVAMMRVGTKAELIVPSNLAYGDDGAGASIPGGATLKFEVELIQVN